MQRHEESIPGDPSILVPSHLYLPLHGVVEVVSEPGSASLLLVGIAGLLLRLTRGTRCIC